MNKDIFGGFCWGVMFTCCCVAYVNYSIASNDAEYKEKTLIELQIEYKKLEIKLLRKGKL